MSALFAFYGLGSAAFGAACVLMGALLGRAERAGLRAERDEARAGRDRCRRKLARLRREREPAEAPAPVPEEAPVIVPARPPVPEAEQAERDRERQALGDLRTWQAGVSAGKRECGGRLADGLRAGLWGLADADIARVLVRVGWYMAEVETEQGGDPYDAWIVLADSLAVGAADLAATELELAEGHGR